MSNSSEGLNAEMPHSMPSFFPVRGLTWPKKINDYTLLGPVNSFGRWRWYVKPQQEPNFKRYLYQVKIDSSLNPIDSISRPCKTRADHAIWEELVKSWFADEPQYQDEIPQFFAKN